MATFKATIRKNLPSGTGRIITHEFKNMEHKDEVWGDIDHWNENTDVYFYEVISIEKI
jgi:hypothetical protein